jgi:hypothetical protein
MFYAEAVAYWALPLGLLLFLSINSTGTILFIACGIEPVIVSYSSFAPS